MGIKPSRPVVGIGVATEGLRTKVGLEQSKLESYFASISEETKGGSRRVSLDRFKSEFPATQAFLELGDVVSQRLFQVLGVVGDTEGLGLEQFSVALYLFTCATEEERLRLVFNMFDLQGGGVIRKKEFRSMSIAIIRGSNEEIPSTFESEFKAMEKAMVDAGMQLYDTNKDGKLSFEEWCVYAREDAAVKSCLKALASPKSLELVERIRQL